MKKYIMFAAMAAVAAVPAFAQDDANTAKPEYLVLTNANGNRVFTGAVEYGKKAITLTSDSIKVQLKGMTTPKRFHKSEVAKISVANAPVADLFDVVWNADGTAKDLGKWNLTVEKKGPKDRIVVNNDNPYGIICPTFKNEYAVQEVVTPAAWTGDQTKTRQAKDGTANAYYKALYKDVREEVYNAINDGFTSEIIFKCTTDTITEAYDSYYTKTEIKPFSNTQSGGFGFSLRPAAEKRNIAYMIATPSKTTPDDLATANYYITKSGSRPEKDAYYHVIASWDKAAGTLKMYINGELVSTVENATAEYKIPNGSSASTTAHFYFGIGADTTTTGRTESSFPGQVVVARIYDSPLAENEVKLLFEQANALKK